MIGQSLFVQKNHIAVGSERDVALTAEPEFFGRMNLLEILLHGLHGNRHRVVAVQAEQHSEVGAVPFARLCQ